MQLEKQIQKLNEIMAVQYVTPYRESRKVLGFIYDKKNQDNFLALLTHWLKFGGIIAKNGKRDEEKGINKDEWMNRAVRFAIPIIMLSDKIERANPEPKDVAKMLSDELAGLDWEEKVTFAAIFSVTPGMVPYRRIPDNVIRMDEKEVRERVNKLPAVVSEIDAHIKAGERYETSDALWSVLLELLDGITDKRDRLAAMLHANMKIRQTLSESGIGVVSISVGGSPGEGLDIFGSDHIDLSEVFGGREKAERFFGGQGKSSGLFDLLHGGMILSGLRRRQPR